MSPVQHPLHPPIGSFVVNLNWQENDWILWIKTHFLKEGGVAMATNAAKMKRSGPRTFVSFYRAAAGLNRSPWLRLSVKCPQQDDQCHFPANYYAADRENGAKFAEKIAFRFSWSLAGGLTALSVGADRLQRCRYPRLKRRSPICWPLCQLRLEHVKNVFIARPLMNFFLMRTTR